jgi:hypothetical protein
MHLNKTEHMSIIYKFLRMEICSFFWAIIIKQQPIFQGFVVDHKYLHVFILVHRGRDQNGAFW